MCTIHSAGEDYIIMSDSPLTLSTEYPNDTITFNILDDNLTECVEYFSIHLNFSEGPLPRLSLNPSTTTVTVLDDDESE